MRYAVLSDVHANLSALTAVLKDLAKRRIEKVFFLGDAVGYGPDPDECVDRLRSLCTVFVAGNHDRGASGRTGSGSFNANARTAIEWTRKHMRPENGAFLRGCPLLVTRKEEGITLVHGTPFEPEAWHYLLRLTDAELNFGYFDTILCFVGHSHWPAVVEKTPEGTLLLLEERRAVLRSGSRYLVNAGSVGQPRDGDPRAGYVVGDGDQVEVVRVGYDIEVTQRKMRQHSLPEPLIERLAYGM